MEKTILTKRMYIHIEKQNWFLGTHNKPAIYPKYVEIKLHIFQRHIISCLFIWLSSLKSPGTRKAREGAPTHQEVILSDSKEQQKTYTESKFLTARFLTPGYSSQVWHNLETWRRHRRIMEFRSVPQQVKF